MWGVNSDEEEEKKQKEENWNTQNDDMNQIAVEAPPLTDGIFPCNDCHIDMEPNPKRRELVDMHDDITAMFDHDSDNRWCLDCHDLNNRIHWSLLMENYWILMNRLSYVVNAMVTNSATGLSESMENVWETGMEKNNICCVCIATTLIHPNLNQ